MSALLKLQLVEATHLDTKEEQPYCRISIVRPHKRAAHTVEDSKQSQYKTKVKKGTEDPEWQQNFKIPSLYRDDILAIDVLDKAKLHHGHRHAKHIGTAFIPLFDLPQNEKLDLKVPLENSDNSTIHLKLKVKAYEKDPLASGKLVAKQASTAARNYAVKKVALRGVTLALTGTAAAPALPFIAGAATLQGVYNMGTKVHDKYVTMMESDPTALLPLEVKERDPKVPNGATTDPVGRIEFGFGSAENLKPMDRDKTGHKTSSDPFCRIYLQDFKGVNYRAWETGLQANDLNPKWEIPPWKALFLEGTILAIIFYDKDIGKKDCFLGTTVIAIDKLIKKYGAREGEKEWTEVTRNLMSEDMKEKGDWGKVHFKFRFITGHNEKLVE